MILKQGALFLFFTDKKTLGFHRILQLMVDVGIFSHKYLDESEAGIVTAPIQVDDNLKKLKIKMISCYQEDNFVFYYEIYKQWFEIESWIIKIIFKW